MPKKHWKLLFVRQYRGKKPSPKIIKVKKNDNNNTTNKIN